MQAKAKYTKDELMPVVNKNDGNPCGDDEEVYAGLCYQKCSVLAGTKHRFRQSAWMCCIKPVCNLFSLASCCKHDFGLCSGFDIAGMKEGKTICPHKPGACFAN